MTLRISEAVTVIMPVVPIGDGKTRVVVGTDRHELGKGDDDFTLVVQCVHEDGGATQLVMRESENGDPLAGAQR